MTPRFTPFRHRNKNSDARTAKEVRHQSKTANAVIKTEQGSFEGMWASKAGRKKRRTGDRNFRENLLPIRPVVVGQSVEPSDGIEFVAQVVGMLPIKSLTSRQTSLTSATMGYSSLSRQSHP